MDSPFSSHLIPQPLLLASLVFALALGCALPAAAADVPAGAPTANAALQCHAALSAFDETLQREGYWLNESAYGYGYPMYGYAEEAAAQGGAPRSIGYLRARPGYEVRTLLASASILAQLGDEQQCEAVLGVAHTLYDQYTGQPGGSVSPPTGARAKRLARIASALAVTDANVPFRSDQLIGARVVNGADEDLGSVADIVLSPKSGKIAYLVIQRGGLFGLGRKYVPVPWGDFKSAAGMNLLVLDADRSRLDAAPEVKEDRFSARGDFLQISQPVDDYWAMGAAK
jgi:sporulation protein YlmC with PRC-barrel domain